MRSCSVFSLKSANHQVYSLEQLSICVLTFNFFFLSLSIMTDPLGMLIDRLPFRRAKNHVREKIVELGLVEDVKELRKKRVRSGKSTGREESNRNESDDDDDRAPKEGPAGLGDSESDESEDESDEEDSDGELVNKTKQKKKELKTNRPKQYGFALKKSDYFSPEMLAAPLRQLVSDGELFFSSFLPMLVFFSLPFGAHTLHADTLLVSITLHRP